MSRNAINIRYYGGAEEVTGSCAFVGINNSRKEQNFLLDAGAFVNGNPEKAYIKNWQQLQELAAIIDHLNAILISHSHYDHMGNLAGIVRRGFKGRILTTLETGDLIPCMLEDGLKIIEREHGALNKKRLLTLLGQRAIENRGRGRRDKGFDPGRKKRKPKHVDLTLFDNEDLEETIERISKYDIGRIFKIGKSIRAQFLNAGHILGSASTLIEADFARSSSPIRIFNSHDIGSSKKGSYLGTPEVPNSEIDIAMLETTYGNREHSERESTLTEMKAKIIETLRRGGKVIVPAFALERTQEFLLFLDEFIHEINAAVGKQIPVYTDSRLGDQITQLYRSKLRNGKHREKFKGTPLSILEYDKFRALNFDSRNSVVQDNQPAIVVSSSGMCNAGAVREHLLHGVGNPKNLVLLIGYAGHGTLANALLNSEDGTEVKINGEQVPVRCEVFRADIFSAHADKTELNEHFDKLSFKGDDYSRAIVFLQHGDPTATASFRDLLLNSDSTLRPENVRIAQRGVSYGFKLAGNGLILAE